MDQHIKDLFEAAEPFEKGGLYQDEIYDLWSRAIFGLEDKIIELAGPEVEKLLADLAHSYFEVEWFGCLHYFYQGYLAAKKELTMGEAKP